MHFRLPNLKGYIIILVAIDSLSKYAQLTLYLRVVTEVFIDNVMNLHGMPRASMSSRVTSHFWKELFMTQRIKVATDSA